jgi:prolyl oligopeptidase
MTSTLAGSDPYRFLEDARDPATARWTAEQNSRTRRFLDSLPQRAHLVERFEALIESDSLSVPVACGNRQFFTARRERAAQASLYVREDGRDRLLFDPVAHDPTGLTAIDWWYPSGRGTYVAYGVSSNGDERSVLGVLRADDGSALDERIPDTRYASLVWLPDESGFLYTRYPPGGNYDVRLYRHELGTPPGADRLLFGEGLKPEAMLQVDCSVDGAHVAVTVYDGWSRSDVYVADARVEPPCFVAAVEGRDALYVASAGTGALYVRTGEGASRGRLFAAAWDRPQREFWCELVTESAATLDEVVLTRAGLVLRYLDEVRSVVKIRRPDGSLESVDALAGKTVTQLSGREDSATFYAAHEGFFEATTITQLDAGPPHGAACLWDAIPTPFDAGAYRSEQVWFTSRDGTRVPMDVLYKAGTPRDGSAPAVLYGYGGFDVALVPAYAPTVVPWLDAGGVYAIANLRGGGEFGEEWHRAGMRERKQNVFDDFIAAAEYLGASGLADPRRVSIVGGSNGGLLVAAVSTQRPELFAAVVCLVPLTDMLRYPDFAIARLWIPEYGDPADPRDAAFLGAYSPYHKVSDGIAYPAMLIASAESDGRVDPMHARKFGARVQAATSSGAPVLVHVEPNAGHGVGKPRRKLVAELADRWSFLFAEGAGAATACTGPGDPRHGAEAP